MENVCGEEFMKAMANLISERSEENYTKFEQEFKKTRFLTPIIMVNNVESSEVNNTDISFVNIVDGGKSSYYLTFTDIDKFNKFKKDNKFEPIFTDIKDFSHMLKEIDKEAKGVIINVGDEALFLPKDTILNL